MRERRTASRSIFCAPAPKKPAIPAIMHTPMKASPHAFGATSMIACFFPKEVIPWGPYLLEYT